LRPSSPGIFADRCERARGSCPRPEDLARQVSIWLSFGFGCELVSRDRFFLLSHGRTIWRSRGLYFNHVADTRLRPARVRFSRTCGGTGGVFRMDRANVLNFINSFIAAHP